MTTATPPDPRRQELAELLKAILGEWIWAHRRWPDRYPPPDRYRQKMAAYIRRNDIAAALVLAKRDYAALCWPCTLPPEAGVDEHGWPTRRGPADRRASRRGERGGEATS